MAQKKIVTTEVITEAEVPACGTHAWIKPAAVIAAAFIGLFMIGTAFAGGVFVGRLSDGFGRTTMMNRSYNGQQMMNQGRSTTGNTSRRAPGMMRGQNAPYSSENMPCGGYLEDSPR